VERDRYEVASSPLGRIYVSRAAIAQIVGSAASESYGVIALAGRSRLSRLLPWGVKKGVDVEKRDEGLVIELRVVVEHGLKLAEVVTAVRARVLYELERMVGLPVASLEIHVESVRRG
jgi:uncharacterized alkaline shock family protein YloU